MVAEGFLYKEFADDLSTQAKAVVPGDIRPEEHEYIVKMVHNFVFLAGEAIAKDPNVTLTVEQASIICQFIGEWTFHKSVDMIKGNVPNQFRDTILQKIAFTVFEIAKQALLKELPQDQMIGVVEHHVKKVYEESLIELMKSGQLTQQQAQLAASQSNIDAMAQADNEAIAQASDIKILKLATFAMLLKKLPNDKVGSILNKFNSSDAQIILQYIQMDNLETTIDKDLVRQCLKDIQTSLPQGEGVNMKKAIRQFGKNVQALPLPLKKLIKATERPLVTMLMDNKNLGENDIKSPQIFQVISKHIEEKLYDYQT